MLDDVWQYNIQVWDPCQEKNRNIVLVYPVLYPNNSAPTQISHPRLALIQSSTRHLFGDYLPKYQEQTNSRNPSSGAFAPCFDFTVLLLIE
jgi:hypothetical protein